MYWGWEGGRERERERERESKTIVKPLVQSVERLLIAALAYGGKGGGEGRCGRQFLAEATVLLLRSQLCLLGSLFLVKCLRM